MSDDVIEDIAFGGLMLSAIVGIVVLIIMAGWALMWANETHGTAVTLAILLAMSVIGAGVSLAVLFNR